ncbi:MAG: 4-alpha-glucanotransferase [Candidatus Peribacteraceae bacterium]|nr:4-alpha-glucanotransferase [Candidatus Peribacteraceae bacterium]MDD5075372.1 4-alpha-glucanotransferase [Candidatus Peribacteraceae bacterium]
MSPPETFSLKRYLAAPTHIPEGGLQPRSWMLNTFLPQFVRPAPVLDEGRIALLRKHGLDEDGAYAVRSGFGAGSLSDLTRLVVSAVRNGEALMAETLPFNDPGPMSANPYLGTPFGMNPAMADIGGVRALRLGDGDPETPCAQRCIALINARGKQMREEGLYEQGRFWHPHLRAFKLDAFRIAYDDMREQGEEEGFGDFRHEHVRDGDRSLDYAVFQALNDKYRTPWQNWEDGDKRKKPIGHVEGPAADPEIGDRSLFHLYVQWHLQRQVRSYADAVRGAGGRVIADRAYGADPHTPETLRSWREEYGEGGSGAFLLDERGWPRYVNAVIDSAHGVQRWGHAAMNWPYAYEACMKLLLDSLQPIAGYADGCRLDYALGLSDGTTYVHPWNDHDRYFQFGPKDDAFRRIAETFPNLAVYCEACGLVGEDAHAARRRAGLRSLECVQWGGVAHQGDPGTVFFTDNQDTHTLPAIVNAGDVDWTLNLGHMRWMLHETGAKAGVDVQTGVLRIIERMMHSHRQIIATTLASLSGEWRCINEVGKQDVSYWQLISPRTAEEMEGVFRRMGEIARQARRAARECVG